MLLYAEPMPNSYTIATILPPSEHFTARAAGAIALFVRDTTLESAYQNHITVFGRNDDKQHRFSKIKYKGIDPTLRLIYGRNKGYAHALVEHFKKHRPGLIEVHNRVNIFKILAKNFTNIPISIYFHNDPLTIKGAMTPKERWNILSRADAIYCCSDYVRRRFLTGLEAGRTDHVHVVYEYTGTIKPEPKQSFILYVGRLIEEKGALELAQAARLVLNYFPTWRIVYAGANRPGGKNDTPYARAVMKELEALGKQALFLGHQPHGKIKSLYARAAVAVVPSTWAEPMGRTAAEALAAGCALVTSGHGGLAEIAGNAGVLVSPVTPNGLALALQGLLENPDTLREVQQLCLEHSRYFDLEQGRPYFDQLRNNLFTKAYGG